MIEVKVINKDNRSELMLTIDGAICTATRIYISESKAELQSDSEGGDSFFDIKIIDEDISDIVIAHSFSNLSKEIKRIFLYPSLSLIKGETQISQGITIRRGYVGVRGGYIGKTHITFNFYFDPDNWKRLWSIKEYRREFRRIFEQQNLPDIQWSPEDARIDGISSPEDRIALAFTVQDANAIIEKEVHKHAELLQRLHELTEASLKPKLQNSRVEQIIRSIEFPPEYYHSGITILSYFADVLRHKNLSEQVKVSIEQSGLNVRLVIESPTGQRELVERTLETYALVVMGKQPINTLTTDPYEIIELKNQLRIANVQIDSHRDMMALKNSEVTYLRTEVEETKASLKRLEQRSDDDRAQLMSLIEGLIEKNADLSSGFRELAEQAIKFQNKKLADALESLQKMVERGVKEDDQREAIKNLRIIQHEDEGVFRQVCEILVKGGISGAASDYLYAWLQFIVGSLPK